MAAIFATPVRALCCKSALSAISLHGRRLRLSIFHTNSQLHCASRVCEHALATRPHLLLQGDLLSIPCLFGLRGEATWLSEIRCCPSAFIPVQGRLGQCDQAYSRRRRSMHPCGKGLAWCVPAIINTPVLSPALLGQPSYAFGDTQS